MHPTSPTTRHPYTAQKEEVTVTTSLQTSSRVFSLHQSPLALPTTIPAVFRAAARLIVANGHYQGDYVPDAFDRRTTTPHAERPMSIVAAIRCVTSPHGDNPHRITELSESAVKVLAGRLEVDGEPAWNDEPHHLEGHVAHWGDVEGRTVESVVAVLEAAADANEVSA